MTTRWSWTLVSAVCLAVLAACTSTISPTPSPVPTIRVAPEASCGGGPEASGSCVVPLTPAPGALSREAAIAAAQTSLSGGTAASVEWSQLTWNPFAQPIGSGPLVWEVRLAGRALPQPTCPADWLTRYPSASDAPCLDQNNGVIVVMDQFSGAVLGWSH